MFSFLVLTCIEHFKGERTISGIYHLLTGKRSSQTMQDAKGYGLDPYFGIYPGLNRRKLDQLFQEFLGEGTVKVKNDAFPELTDKGKENLYAYQGPELNFFKGLEQQAVIPTFERRLHLLIQTITNMNADITFFFPIVDEPKTQRWVKKVYANHQNHIPELVQSLYKELDILLTERTELEADLFTHRLTGPGLIGMTIEQLKTKAHLSAEDVTVGLQHMYYFLFNRTKARADRFPVLTLCTEGLEEPQLITRSAQKTYHYLAQGLNLEEIVTLRRLKTSTIQDHIVETALVIADFPVEPFLVTEDVEAINMMVEKLDTQRLKHIYQAFEGRYDYFQLRLALAHVQHRRERNHS